MFKKIIFVASLIFNLLFALVWFFDWLNSPTYRLGVLTQDVNAGFFADSDVIFRIPKGITVRDASPRGISAIGQFENNRFEIILTSDRDVVNYDVPKDRLFQFGSLYSTDNPIGTKR